MDLYLDISSGSQLTILSAGLFSIDQNAVVHVKTADTGGRYLTIEEIEALPSSTKAKVHAAAKLVYIGAETTMKWGQNSSWFGTLYAQQSLGMDQNFELIGALACPGTMSVSQNIKIYEYVLADYAKQNWE